MHDPMSTRNPHAGQPFSDDEAAIAAALAEASVPPLLCSLVHMTGDPSWIRSDLQPHGLSMMEYQGLSSEEQEEARRRALPAVLAYRDGGCEPQPVTPDVIREMMAFIACQPVPEDVAVMFDEDLQLEGGDCRAVTWGDELPAAVKAASPVVVIGCGESGILAGIRLAQAGLPFTIIEKSAGPGGVWRDNAYPGARVDVSSHHYCYSFEPSYHWSEYFCRQPELQAYFERVVHKYALGPHCRFATEVTAATWDEATGRWQVEVRGPDGAIDTLDARFLISGVGSLSLPKLPDIPGMDDFAGPSFHSARWPKDLDLTGKRYAQVGAGASGFQIAPAVVDQVEHLDIFLRTTQWMIPNLNYMKPVPEGDAWAMRHLPFYGRWFRFLQMVSGIINGTAPYRRDPDYDDSDGHAISEYSAQRREQLTQWITSNLADRPDLLAQSIPEYPPMAKRILQDDGSWLRMLKRPNVDFVRTGIEKIVPEGIVTVDGVLHEADVICYATGFRANDYLAPIDWTGRNGVSLREQWGDAPTAYLGITIPNFPNLFLLYGPGTNLAHGASLIFQSECQINYAMSAIHEVLAHDDAAARTAIEVRKDVHDEFVERYRHEIDQLVWAHPSVEYSHYKNPQGKIYALSPWPTQQYWAWTLAVDPREYVLD
jgi:4-hydroxyacetophenone monooxygenase